MGLPYTFLLVSSCGSVLLLCLFSYYSEASLAYFIPLGILNLLNSFGHHWRIPILHSHGLLLNLSGFPNLITIPFTFGVYWPFYQPHLLILSFGLLQPIFSCLPFLIISMGLLLLSLGSLGLACFLWGILLFYKPMDHYSCHLGLMVFFSLY